ncbi:unnamed protein product [Dovyalis caffra]|uniref:Uncharacterized protein n=1 Tax=Dovyalis caffra TaxID=77055 RepID=A0AAV1S2L9_9ROSI|nr:unnamed protein product [Dovyalis caffra]
MGKDIEVGGEFSAKDYHDPPPAQLIDAEEFIQWSFYWAIVPSYKSQTDATKNGDECGGVGILGIAWSFGGHINRAVTFGLFLARKVSLVRAILYMVAQSLGAVLRSLVLLFGYTVFSATDPKRNARDSNVPVPAPLPIGFAVFMVHWATIPITGTGINPARIFGAAVVYKKQKAWDDHLIFWVGPFIGAPIAALYRPIHLESSCSESPWVGGDTFMKNIDVVNPSKYANESSKCEMDNEAN